MVSHSHLSAGNSLSSESRDLFAEYGISNPNSPSLSTPLVLSSDSIEMRESEPNPVAHVVSSDESTSLANEIESNFGQAFESNVSEIFKAAQHFTHQDREDALFERKKNANLMNCLLAHGFSVTDINAFVSEGKLANIGHAQKVFDGNPQRNHEVPCVGEVPLPPISRQTTLPSSGLDCGPGVKTSIPNAQIGSGPSSEAVGTPLLRGLVLPNLGVTLCQTRQGKLLCLYPIFLLRPRMAVFS